MIVAIELGAVGAAAGLTCLRTVADVAVRTRGAVGGRGIVAAARRFAGVDGARVGIGAVEQGPWLTGAVLAQLGTVADRVVDAERAVGDVLVQTPQSRFATIRLARVAVVAVERRAVLTGPGQTRFGTIAQVVVGA